ncbi:uncharacterized protein LOC116417557 [Nasonia vitripennis]|uniref:Uncharacterized protein n=1 Tax=Nasonia vitripennis TaxID=7425 RepID=A0A7M7QHJ5_NASVI|nr:uncharacterized protein LOC116417557 [Nasonia vitripennis]
MRHSEFFANYKSLYTGHKRQLIVLLLTDAQTLNIFEQFTKIHNLSLHAWFVVFWARHGATLHDYCEKPKVNRFHLNFDVRMLVKCLENPEIREWYALDPKAEVRVNELMEWMPGTGLIQKTKLTFYQRRRDFHGKLLKVTTVKELVDATETHKKSNQQPEMVLKLMTEMMLYMNFNISFMPSISNYGLYNQTEHKWSGMLGNLSRGEIDMCFTDMTVTQVRQRYFDWTWPLWMTGNVLTIRKFEKAAVKWTAYSKAFVWDIWISILFLMIIASVVITMIKAKVRNGNWDDNDFLENQLYVWGIFCNRALPKFPDSLSLRIAYVSLFFCAIAIITAYSGSIVSNLTNLETALPFTSIEEFIKLGTYKLSIKSKSYDQEYIAYSNDPTIIKLKNFIVRNEDLPANNVQGLSQICQEKTAFFTSDAAKRKVAKTIPCQITTIPMVGNRYMALALTKKSPLTSFVNYHIRRFEDYGLMKRTKNLYLERDGNLRKRGGSVGIDEIAPLLGILAFGVIISLFILSLEYVYYYCKSVFRRC